MFAWSGHVYAGRLKRLAENYLMQKPDGDGPFPAIIMVSGCSGFNSPAGKPVYDRVQGRLRDMGFPNVENETVRGDMFVVVQIETPKKLTTRQEELLRELAELEEKHVSPRRKSFFEKVKSFFVETEES